MCVLCFGVSFYFLVFLLLVLSLKFIRTGHDFVDCCAANVALLRPSLRRTENGTEPVPSIVDGSWTTSSCAEMMQSTEGSWWSVDLGQPMDIGRVCIGNDETSSSECQFHAPLNVSKQHQFVNETKTIRRRIRAVRRRRHAAAADILLTPPPPIVTDRRRRLRPHVGVASVLFS